MDVVADRAEALALAVAEVVTLVDYHEPVAAQRRQFSDRPADRQHPRTQSVVGGVVLPHPHEVARAQDERLDALVVLEDARDGGGHQRLAEADDVADEHAAALVEVARGDLHGRLLVGQQAIAEHGGNAEFVEPRSRLVG